MPARAGAPGVKMTLDIPDDMTVMVVTPDEAIEVIGRRVESAPRLLRDPTAPLGLVGTCVGALATGVQGHDATTAFTVATIGSGIWLILALALTGMYAWKRRRRRRARRPTAALVGRTTPRQ